jgi:hypothetical protein
MKLISAATSILGFVFAAVGVPTAGQKSMNAMAAIYGAQGGGINYGFSVGQTRFTGGDMIRAIGLYQFLGTLYLQPVTSANEIGQGKLCFFLPAYMLGNLYSNKKGKPGPASLGLKHYAPAFHIKGGSLYQINNEVRGQCALRCSSSPLLNACFERHRCSTPMSLMLPR